MTGGRFSFIVFYVMMGGVGLLIRISRINAMVTLEMVTPEIQNFISEMNQRIKYYEDTLSVRAGRNEGKEDDEQPPLPE